MDEESRWERILSAASSVFPQRKAGSKACRETSVEARLLQGGTTALESEGIAFLAGPGASYKTGGGLVCLFYCQNSASFDKVSGKESHQPSAVSE
jgi:hypothetical protein